VNTRTYCYWNTPTHLKLWPRRDQSPMGRQAES
jgi:hypothetical protein